jgi:hypothetical protein
LTREGNFPSVCESDKVAPLLMEENLY